MPGRKRKAGDTSRDEESSAEKKAKPLGDKFGGLTEEEVCKLVLPDHMKPGLDIIFIGINPGLYSAYLGHHYCNASNHFWPCLYESGLIPRKLTYREDAELLDYGIGITNIVPRTTRSADKLSRKEMKEWSKVMIERMQGLKPLVACFNGKGIYEVFSGQKCVVGLQKEPLPGTDTVVYVMPSTSGRAATYPRRADKLKFFAELKALRDSMRVKNGLGPVEHGLGPQEHSSPDTVALPQERKESVISPEAPKPQDVPTASASSSTSSSHHVAGIAQQNEQHVPALYNTHKSSQHSQPSTRPTVPQPFTQTSPKISSTPPGPGVVATGPVLTQANTVSSLLPLTPQLSSTSREEQSALPHPVPLAVPVPVVFQSPHHLYQYVYTPTARDCVGNEDRPPTL